MALSRNSRFFSQPFNGICIFFENLSLFPRPIDEIYGFILWLFDKIRIFSADIRQNSGKNSHFFFSFVEICVFSVSFSQNLHFFCDFLKKFALFKRPFGETYAFFMIIRYSAAYKKNLVFFQQLFDEICVLFFYILSKFVLFLLLKKIKFVFSFFVAL